MIAAKMDLLLKKLEALTNMETAKIMDAHMTCEVCGNVGHSGNDCLETREEASFVNNGNNNGFRNNNYSNQGWNSRPNIPFNNQNGGGIPGKPEPTQEHVSAISTGWSKPSRRIYEPNHVWKTIHQIQDPWDESPVLHKKHNGYPGITCTIYYQEIKNALF
jgi:hypothetical protein